MATTQTVTSAASLAASAVKPAKLVRAAQPGVTFRQRFTPDQVNLQYLSCGEFSLPANSRSQAFCLAEEESLLFQWEGESVAYLDGREYHLSYRDTLYVPRGMSFSLANEWDSPARLAHTSAPAERVHPVHHARFAEVHQREDRIRRLKGKDVYLMFDVGEAAEKLVAGYTYFQPYQRSWPPHNHTDQEEVYIFIEGHGAMEVYESPETLSFVHSVNRGDAVSIPMLNYHPVFSQDEPLQFIWCIAGERYWVGDKNKDFMKGTAGPITT